MTRDDNPGRDESWFDHLYRDQYAAVYAYARRRVPDADDVVAEVFTTAWRARSSIPDPPLPWLLRTAGNVVLHAHRSTSRRRRLTVRAAVLAAPGPDHADAVAGACDATALVTRALAALRPDDRELLRLMAWDGLDHGQLAAVVGCSPATVRVRVHRARRRFAAALDRLDPDGALDTPTTNEEIRR